MLDTEVQSDVLDTGFRRYDELAASRDREQRGVVRCLAVIPCLTLKYSRMFWIPASAGMTNSRQAARNVPGGIHTHHGQLLLRRQEREIGAARGVKSQESSVTSEDRRDGSRWRQSRVISQESGVKREGTGARGASKESSVISQESRVKGAGTSAGSAGQESRVISHK